MGVFVGTERQCTEDEHDDEDENDFQTSEFELKGRLASRSRTAWTPELKHLIEGLQLFCEIG